MTRFILVITLTLLLSACGGKFVRDYGFEEKKNGEGYEEATDIEYYNYAWTICWNESSRAEPDRLVPNLYYVEACMLKYGFRLEYENQN